VTELALDHDQRHTLVGRLNRVRMPELMRSPRSQETLEVLNASFELTNPYDALPVGVGRGISQAIAAAEAIQLLGGFSDPEMLISITPNFERYLDGGVLAGSYGPRIRTQLSSVVERLRRDPDTRQALAVIWDPLQDAVGQAPRDLPCTVFFDFMIRDGRLLLHSTMRANDVYLGLPYNAFMNTQLQISVATILGIPAGSYFHNAKSLHAYTRDLPELRSLHPPDGTRPSSLKGIAAGSVDELQARARGLWALTETPAGETERWYVERIRPHVRAVRGRGPA
jgi:thymidylate synthase